MIPNLSSSIRQPGYHTSACGHIISWQSQVKSHTISSPVAQLSDQFCVEPWAILGITKPATYRPIMARRRNKKYWFYCCISSSSSVTPGLDKTSSNTQGTVQRVLLTPCNVTPSFCTLGIVSQHPENNRLQSCTDVYKDRLNCTLGGWGYERALGMGENANRHCKTIEQKKRKNVWIVDLYDDGNNLEPRPQCGQAGLMKQNPSKLFRKFGEWKLAKGLLWFVYQHDNKLKKRDIRSPMECL